MNIDMMEVSLVGERQGPIVSNLINVVYGGGSLTLTIDEGNEAWFDDVRLGPGLYRFTARVLVPNHQEERDTN